MTLTPKHILAWLEMHPKLYYKDGKIYGAMGTVEGDDGILYVAAMVEHEDSMFTIGMLKDIILLHNKRTIVLITDVESKQKLIRRALDRYGYTYRYENGIMYSKKEI